MSYKIQNRSPASKRLKFIKRTDGQVSFVGSPVPTYQENTIQAGWCMAAISPLPELTDPQTTFELSAAPMGTDGRVSLYRNGTLVSSMRYNNLKSNAEKVSWFNGFFGVAVLMAIVMGITVFTIREEESVIQLVFEDDDIDYIDNDIHGWDVTRTAFFREQYRLAIGLKLTEIDCTGAIDFAGVLVLPDEVSGTMRTSTQSIDFADNGEMVVGLETLGFRALELTTWTPPIPPVTISCSGANAVIKTINPVTIKGNVAITMIATRNGEVSESTIPNIPVTEMPLGVFIEWVYGRDNAIKIDQGGPLGIAIARIGSTGYDPTLTQLKYKIETDDEIKFTPAQGDILSPAVSISSKQFIACMEITPVQDINCVGEPDEMIFPGGIQVRGLVEFVGYQNKPSNEYKNIVTVSNNVAEFTDLVTALRMDALSPVFDINGVAFIRKANGDLRVMSNAVSGVSASVYIRATEMRISPPPTGNVLIGKLTSGDDTVEFCVSSI